LLVYNKATNRKVEFKTKRSAALPYYLAIALDIASRIKNGEFDEGAKIYGRSIMASEYSTSPETIRRAIRLLADMKVVDVKPQSGAVVLSKDNARRYIKSFEEDSDTHDLYEQLHDLIKQYAVLNKKLADTVKELIKSRYTFAAAGGPIPNYEVKVENDSPLIGKNLEELKFWRSTGATIIAIRRGAKVILSPGPYAELYGGDVIVLIGSPASGEAANKMLNVKEE